MLCVQMQRGLPCMWCLVDDTAQLEFRRFRLYSTGHPVEENPGRYVGTFQDDPMEVFHLFEEE